MEVQYYLDPETGLAHIYQHGVTEDEVEYVLRMATEESAAQNHARQTLGQALSGRYLRVIHTDGREPGTVFVITAYELQGRQLQAFRRRQRRRGR